MIESILLRSLLLHKYTESTLSLSDGVLQTSANASAGA